MSITRRSFVTTTLAVAAGGAAILPAAISRATAKAQPATSKVSRAAKPLKLLILGGTAFTGPELVKLALGRGHAVTVFNRGLTEKRIGELPGEVEKLIGDRDPDVRTGLSALGLERTWNAVIDTSGQFPRHVRTTAELFAKRASHYTFISSISALKTPRVDDADESAELNVLDDPDIEDFGKSFENYGGLKAACEAAAEKAMPGRVCNIRPGLIVGPGDPTDRFTYWPVRVSRRGELLCPGSPTDPIQFIDVRDLAAFILLGVEKNLTGVFHAIGPDPSTTIGDLVRTSKELSKSDAKFTWIDAEFLETQQVSPWGDMPVWIPPASGEGRSISFAKAKAAGLIARTLADTVKATLEWYPREVERRKRAGRQLIELAEKEGKPRPQLADPDKLRAGIDPDREKAVLEAWSKRPSP